MYKIDYVSYNCENLIKTQDDSRMLEEFVSEYNINDTYDIGEAISQKADESVGIYYTDIYENAQSLGNSDYWFEALSVSDSEFTLDKLLQLVWYYYNESQFYQNREEIVKNIMIKHFNECNTKNDENNIDDALMEEIDNIMEYYEVSSDIELFCGIKTEVESVLKEAKRILKNS